MNMQRYLLFVSLYLPPPLICSMKGNSQCVMLDDEKTPKHNAAAINKGQACKNIILKDFREGFSFLFLSLVFASLVLFHPSTGQQ